MLETNTVDIRSLTNGMKVVVHEYLIVDEDINGSLSWFDVGMLSFQESINPLKYIPKVLNDMMLMNHDLGDSEGMVSTLTRIGDWLAGWEFARSNKGIK